VAYLTSVVRIPYPKLVATLGKITPIPPVSHSTVRNVTYRRLHQG